MSAGAGAVLSSLLTVGSQVYASRQQEKLQNKQLKEQEQAAQKMEREAEKEKKEQLKAGGAEAKKRNLRMRAYRTGQQSLLSGSAANRGYGLG